LQEYGGDGERDERAREASNERFLTLSNTLNLTRPEPPELQARRDKLDREWRILQAFLSFQSFNLRSDIDDFFVVETYDGIEHQSIDLIHKELQASRERVPHGELPILEKMLSLIDEHKKIAADEAKYSHSISEAYLVQITDALTDDEMASVTDDLVALVREGDRLLEANQQGKLRPEQMAAWELMAEGLTRNFEALSPRKPNFEEWLEGETQVPARRLSDQLIKFWRESIQSPPETSEEEEP
jgi:hypothetical protein